MNIYIIGMIVIYMCVCVYNSTLLGLYIKHIPS